MKRIVLLLILVTTYFIAVCCDCGRGMLTVEDFNENDWIFIGTLISQERPSDHSHRKCLYKVLTGYKGVVQGDTVEVSDAENIGACGLGRLTTGADYLIYARGKELKRTSSCQENSRVPIFVLPRDSVAINNIKAGKYRGAIDDTVNTAFHSDTSFLNAHVLKAKKNTLQKFYQWDGKISAEGKYKNGLPDGWWRYYEWGELVKYGKYRNGKKDSLWVSQYGASKDIEEYKEGEYTYRRLAFQDGKIHRKEEPVGDGRKWVEIVYHDNGKPRFIVYANPPKRNDKGYLRDPVWDGPFKTLSKTGVTLEEGIFENGREIGHWKYYYKDGTLRMEGNYTEGEKSGVWKIYRPNKKIKATGAYEKNEKIGEWRYYDTSGKEIPPNPELIKEDEDPLNYSGY